VSIRVRGLHLVLLLSSPIVFWAGNALAVLKCEGATQAKMKCPGYIIPCKTTTDPGNLHPFYNALLQMLQYNTAHVATCGTKSREANRWFHL
jgi:hypothetical protein